MEQSDACIFTVGTLFEGTCCKKCLPGEKGSYEHMNRDTAKSVGDMLSKIGGKKMVYLSGSHYPPYKKRYLSTKMEAEEYLSS